MHGLKHTNPKKGPITPTAHPFLKIHSVKEPSPKPLRCRGKQHGPPEDVRAVRAAYTTAPKRCQTNVDDFSKVFPSEAKFRRSATVDNRKIYEHYTKSQEYRDFLYKYLISRHFLSKGRIINLIRMKKTLRNGTLVALGGALALFALASDQTVLPSADIKARSVPSATHNLASDSEAESAQLSLPYEDIRTVGKGDTLMALLTEAGVTTAEASRAIQAMAKIYKPRRIKPGQRILLTLQPQMQKAPRLLSLTFSESVERDVAVRQTKNGYHAETVLRPLNRRSTHAAGRIDSSLYVAGLEAGLPQSTLAKLIQIFSFDVDFQRDIRRGDTFDLLFDEYSDDSGRVVKSGNILLAQMMLRGKPIRLYRYETRDGQVDYYDAKGKSVRKALLRTPIDGARISSGFGKRRHPILGYTHMHKGLDFAARRGTPIYAAGDGVIEYAGRNGGYGKYVRIRHNGTYKTAYAHMQRFGRGIRKGHRVGQGQVIGYVGSTGRSTGPHLHYEVHKSGRQVNPRSVKLPSGRKLQGRELAAFKAHAATLEDRYAALVRPQQIAERRTN